jgi:hypothetical protein
MVDLQELSDDELEQLQKQFRRLSKHYANLSDHIDGVADVGENEDKEVDDREALKK